MLKAIVALTLVAAAWPMTVSAQKKSAQEIEQQAQRLASETQRLRNQERAAIAAATRALLASPGVQRQPQLAQAVRKHEQTIVASRARADRDLPGELAGLYKLKASGRSAPPIPGKSGSLTGEGKVDEHYTREANDVTAAIKQAKLSTLQLEVLQYQASLDETRRNILKMYKDLLRNFNLNCTQVS